MSVLRGLAMAAVVCCVSAAAFAADEIKITDIPKGAKIGKLDVGQKSRVMAGNFTVSELPEAVKGLAVVSVPRGDSKKPAEAYKVTIDQPATAYLLVMNRGTVKVPEGWTKVEGKVVWKDGGTVYNDTVYTKRVEAGEVEVPGHGGTAGGSYGVPNSIAFKAE